MFKYIIVIAFSIFNISIMFSKSESTVEVVSGIITGQEGSMITYARIPVPVQTEPIREFTKNLVTKFQNNAERLSQISTKINNGQALDAKKIFQQTIEDYNKNLSSYSNEANLNTTEMLHITKLVQNIEKQIEKISAIIE